MKRALIRNSIISLVVFVIITSIFSYVRLKNTLLDEAFEEIKVQLNGFIYMLEDEGIEDINDACYNFGRYTDTRATVIDANTGEVLGDSHEDKDTMDNHLYRTEVSKAIRESEGTSQRYSKTLEVDSLYYAKYIEINGKELVVRTATPLYAIEDVYNDVWFSVAVALLISMIVAFLIIYKFNNNVIEPINDIKDVALDIAKGHYGKSVYINSYDEVFMLSKALNTLSKNLKTSFEKISTRNAQLEAILRSFKHGLMVCDLEGNVQYSNENFSKIIGIEESIENKNIYHFLFDENIYNILAEIKIVEEGQPVVKENVAFSDGSFRNYSGYYIKDVEHVNRGILLVVEDVTNMRKLERMRSSFVSNVTHELKTPITCISGYTQTLLNGALEDEKNAVRFLGIINDETERLNLLIDDILTLSKLENDKETENMHEVDMVPIAEDILELMKLKYTDLHGVDLLIKANKDERYKIDGNDNKIKQIIINLVDNSIRHTKEGYVAVEFDKQDDKVIMTVTDTGIGIEEAHHERLFERFYRVDKHRSRESGGTGLGLSIVKHLAILHNAEISLKSEVDVGTSITITFPIYDATI